MDADPLFTQSSLWGTVAEAHYYSAAGTSELRHHGDSLAPGCLADRVVSVGGNCYMVRSNTADTITVLGDATQDGSVDFPPTWRIEREYRLASNSPNRGAGIGPGADPTVPATDMDGDARSGATCDIGPDEYNAVASIGGSWGRIWVTTGASSAAFAHCVVEKGAGLLAETPNVTVSQSLFHGNREYGARLTAGTAAVSDTTATLNMGPGIDAAGIRPLTRCAALWNGGDGLLGTALSACTAYGNGADGIGGASATGSTAEFNAGNGFTLTAGATGCIARDNRGKGIVTTGGNLTDCEAVLNTGRGIGISGGGTASGCMASYNGGGGIQTTGATVTGCAVIGNTGIGVTGSGTSSLINSRVLSNTGQAVSGVRTITDSVVGGNTPGITGASTISGTYVGANAGDGVAGGTISNSTIVWNTENGVNTLSSLSNSWVVGNGSSGVYSPGAFTTISNSCVLGNGSYGVYAPGGFTTISNSWVSENGSDGIFSSGGLGSISSSSILNNDGTGTRNIGSLTGSNIYGNRGAWQAFDNVAAGSGDRDFTNNWWGTVNTALLQAGEEWDNMPFLQDTLDGSGNWLLDVWPYRTSMAPNAPDASLAPAFLLAVTPNLDNAANVGVTTFTLTFSKVMDTNPSSVMTVTFGLDPPYEAHVVLPSPGWLPDGKTWQGRFAIQSDTGDGVNTIKVSGAVAADGFHVPEDTARRFTIDTTGGGAANNGLAQALGTGLRCSWTETGKPEGAQGYNIRRSATGMPGSYVKINAGIVSDDFYVDSRLDSRATYFYIVDIVDANSNSTQWTPPFYGTTGEFSDAEDWALYD